MAISQAPLTPLANTTPAVAEIPALEPSGVQWYPRFPASNQIADCSEPFKSALTEFVEAIKAAGANVTISNTFRPPERAYLMHWCWRIVNDDHDPEESLDSLDLPFSRCVRNRGVSCRRLGVCRTSRHL